MYVFLTNILVCIPILLAKVTTFKYVTKIEHDPYIP